MKFAILTCIFSVLLFLGWYFSAAHLEPIIHKVFNPSSHEIYMDYWFTTFVSIEAVIVLAYILVFIKMARAKKKI